MCVVAHGLQNLLARQLDLLAGPHADQLAGLPAAVEPLADLEQVIDQVDGVLGQVDRRRLHLHHPPAGDVDRQGGDVVQVRVRDEPGRRAHEVPGLGAEVEAELQLGNSPVGLHGRPRVALDREVFVLERAEGAVVEHDK